MQKSLSTQIIALSLLLVLIPTAVVTIYSSERILSSSFDLMVGRLKDNTYLVAESFRGEVDNILTKVRLISQADVFETNDVNAKVAYLDELRVEDSNILDLVLYDIGGRQYAGASGESMLPTVVPQPAEQIGGLFQKALSGRQGDTYVSARIDSDGPPAVIVSTPITDDENFAVIGVLMVVRTIEPLRSKLVKLKQQSNFDIEYYLVNGFDIAVLSTDTTQENLKPFVDPEISSFLAEQFKDQGTGEINVSTSLGEQRSLKLYSQVLSVDQFLDMQWGIVAKVPLASIEAPILAVRSEALTIAIACAAIGLLFGLLAARKITNPLRRLILWTQRIEAGEGTGELLATGPEEVKVLGNSLVKAFDRLDKYADSLKQTTAALNQAQKLSSVGSWNHDPRNGANWISDEAYLLLGYELGVQTADVNFIQKHVHEEDRERVDVAIATATADRRPTVKFEHRVVKADGEVRWSRTVIALDFDEAWVLRQMRGVFQDITNAKNLEDQLRQSQKMEAVGQLTGGIAHDFNNLLGIILGNVELAGDDLPDDDPRKQRLVKAQFAVERGAKLTRNLLAFSRQQPLQPQVVNLNKTLESMRELLHRTLGEQIEINFVIGAGLWQSEVDPAQMENALLNLALNARDAMPAGGKLTIETSNARLDAEYAAGEVDLVAGQYVMVAVSDSGTGMTEAVKGSAFDPFFTTKAVGSGTGLGLSMVHGFVKQSRGHIKIYSEVGEGTTFRIYLPRSNQEFSDPRRPSALDDEPRGRGERVLVVEDDENLRSLVGEMLNDLGYFVLEAADGEQALEVVANEPEIDALLSDVVLPGGMNGRALATRLLERIPSLAVLYMSGYTANVIVHHKRLDADASLLQKPFRRVELARALREVIQG